MKLQDQVCNLELSKELKKLGVKQESLFYWTKNPFWFPVIGSWKESAKPKEAISAFTASELGEMLPEEIYSFHSIGRKGKWVCSPAICSRNVIDSEAETEVNCRAKMLIYLIKNKLINL